MKTFETVISKYERYLEESPINKISGKMHYPFITFAGLGEPLLHPQIAEFVSKSKKRGFSTVLFTNASMLTPKCARALLKSGIDRVYISFWGIKKNEYEKAMGLDYERVLRNIEHFATCGSNSVSLTITWIQSPIISSTVSEIREFWREKGIAVDIDAQPWNRAGYLTNSIFDSVFCRYSSIDYSKKIWCSQLFFADTISWNGDVILCSQDYFEKRHVFGNINNSSPLQIAQKKKKILTRKMRLELCLRCKKPSHNYPFGSQPWDNVLDANEKSKYWYP